MVPTASRIVFTARFYRQSKTRKGTLEPRGSYRLWQVHPDGSGLKPLTDTHHDVQDPCLSSDRRSIYLHAAPSEQDSHVLSRVPVQGGKIVPVSGLAHFGSDGFSPNGRYVARIDRNGDVDCLNIYDMLAKKTQQIPHVGDFAWSPDSKQLHLIRPEKRSTFLDVETGKESPAPHLYNVTWLPDGTLIGDSRQDFVGKFPLLRAHVSSTTVETLLLTPKKEQMWEAGISFYMVRHHWWHPVPRKPQHLVVEMLGDMSDGAHYGCLLVDLTQRTWKPLPAGKFLGLSTDGKYLATAEAEWIGPYKQGGARCGALEIVNLATGKSRAITTELVHVTGGFWME